MCYLATNWLARKTTEMKLLLFLAVVASGLMGAILLAETKSSPRNNLNSPLGLLGETESGTDYKKREYVSYTWTIKNVGKRNIWLPLPKDRFQSKTTPPRSFLYRTRASESWTSPRLADHRVNYEAEWVRLPPGEKHRLFTTTFHQEDDRFKEVEVCLTYKDDAGKIHKERLSWLAAPPLSSSESTHICAVSQARHSNGPLDLGSHRGRPVCVSLCSVL
jgi:hypothetical protein